MFYDFLTIFSFTIPYYFTSLSCHAKGLTLDDLEAHLTELAGSGDMFVKIDRPLGITNFKKTRAPEVIYISIYISIDTPIYYYCPPIHYSTSLIQFFPSPLLHFLYLTGCIERLGE